MRFQGFSERGRGLNSFIDFIVSGWSARDTVLFTGVFLVAPLFFLLVTVLRRWRGILEGRVVSQIAAPFAVAIAVPPAMWGVKSLAGIPTVLTPHHYVAGLVGLWPASLVAAWVVSAAARRVPGRVAVYVCMMLAFGAWHFYCFKALELDGGKLFGAIPIDGVVMAAAGLAGVPIVLLAGLAGAWLHRFFTRAVAAAEGVELTDDGERSRETPKPAGKLAVLLFMILLMVVGAGVLLQIRRPFRTWLARNEAAGVFRSRPASIGPLAPESAEQRARFLKAVQLLEGSAAIEKPFVTSVLWRRANYDPGPPDWFFVGLLVPWLQDAPGIDAVILRMLDAAGEALAVLVEPVDYQPPQESEGMASWHVLRLAIALSPTGEKPPESETSWRIQGNEMFLSAPLAGEVERLAIALVSTDHGASNEVEVDVRWLNLAREAKQGSREALAALDTHVSLAATSSQDNLYYLQLQLMDDLRLAEGFPGRGWRPVRPSDILLWLEGNEGNVFWDAEKRMWRLKEPETPEAPVGAGD